MKKAIGQTVREIKREVNKKVLKVPGIEQKVLDATSNEPWGPHGSLLADIAAATRNYHEYQMVMAVIWKRINDTGKNWRHVYKALTVLEYLVANGSERVIDEIREHAYQISTLSDFQYIDSNGRDQGNNVRKKSLSLVLLINDKERIIEVRQKAAANRDKFRNNSAGGMYRPGSYSSSGANGDRYDDHYGSREEDISGYGYGREREWGSRDDDRYGHDGDQYGHDGDQYGRDYEERYTRDSYRDDEYRGRSQSIDDYQYGPRSRSSDRDHDRSYDDDGQHSSRGSNAKAEDHSLEARLERKISEKNMCAPPSHEGAVGESRSPLHSERDGETTAASAPGGSSRVSDNPHQTPAPGTSPLGSNNQTEATAAAVASTATSGNQEVEASDEFDPRGPVLAAPAASNNVEMDLLGSLSESFSSNALALVPSTSATTTPEGNANLDSTASFAALSSESNNFSQSFEDPFGDSPFKAIPSSDNAPSQPQSYQNLEPSQSSGLNMETVSNFGFGDSFSVVPHSASGPNDTQPFSTNSQFLSQDLSTSLQETDILADILPPAPLPGMTSQQNVSALPAAQTSPSFSATSGQVASQSFSAQTGQNMQQSFSAAINQPAPQALSVPTGQHVQQAYSAPNGQPVQPHLPVPASQHAQQPISAHTGQPSLHAFSLSADQSMQPPFVSQVGQPAQSSGHVYSGLHSQVGSLTPGASYMSPQSQSGYNGSPNSGNFLPQVSTAPIPSQMAPQAPTGQLPQSANYFPQHGGSSAHTISHLASQFPTDQASQFNSGSFIPQQGNAAAFTHQPLGVPSGKLNDAVGSLLGQSVTNAHNASQCAASSTGSNFMVSQPSKDKFETKSTVWADTLSRGLVNLNISGPKINPLADIGVDFDAINRKEKRMEKPTTTAVMSTVTMGKAMGSGSGIGRAGAGALRAPPSPMMGSGMGMGMGNGPGFGMGMGGYGGMNASMGMGMGMGMGVGQGVQMQQPPTGLPPGPNIPGNYNNSMMGTGGYPPQQPSGGGYR